MTSLEGDHKVVVPMKEVSESGFRESLVAQSYITGTSARTRPQTDVGDTYTPRGVADVSTQDASENGRHAGYSRQRSGTSSESIPLCVNNMRTRTPTVAAFEKQREGLKNNARERFKQPSPTQAREDPDSQVIVAQPEKITERLVSEVKPTVGKYQSPGQHADLQFFRVQNFQPRHLQRPFQHPILPSIVQSSQQPSMLETWVTNSEPLTRPMSQEQLIAVLQGVYHSLVTVETGCREADQQIIQAQADPRALPKFNHEHWQGGIALHTTLLCQHYDFLLASQQHPNASAALRLLASKHCMPARMWRHAIHTFLELLRCAAPLQFMITFFHNAYPMMMLLYETVPVFEDIWIECAGDLARYRMAIEEDDTWDREVFKNMATDWYLKVSSKAPTTGRLYHHLAILARPNAFQELFYYAKSLCVEIPYTSARESILILFQPVLNSKNHQSQYRLPPLDTSFIKAHGIFFTKQRMDEFLPAVDEFLGALDNHIQRVTRKFREQGYHIAITQCALLVDFGSDGSPLRQRCSSHCTFPDIPLTEPKRFENAQHFSNETLKVVLKRLGDPNVLPYIHCILVFLHSVSEYPAAMHLLEDRFPWPNLVEMLNNMIPGFELPSLQSVDLHLLMQASHRPLPEDFALRGLPWSKYYSEDWFSSLEEGEEFMEMESMTDQRKERILWLASRIASRGLWISWDSTAKKFNTIIRKRSTD